MSKTTSTTETTGRLGRLTPPKGKIGPVAIVLLAKSASLVGVIFAFYFIAFFAAVRLVPITMGFVKDGTGVTMDLPFETVIAAWIAPSVFLIAFIFTLCLVLMRFIWRGRQKVVARVQGWALGKEEAAAADTRTNNRSGVAKSARARDNGKTAA